MEKQREKVRVRVERYRALHKGVTSLGGVTEKTAYHPILYALVDEDKRRKLERLCEELRHRRLLGEVYYGAGVNALDFEIVEQFLGATEK